MFSEITLREHQSLECLECPNGHSVLLLVRKTTRKDSRLVYCPRCGITMTVFAKRIEGVLKG